MCVCVCVFVFVFVCVCVYYIYMSQASADREDVSMLGSIGLGPSGEGSDGGVLFTPLGPRPIGPPTDQGALKTLMEDIYDGDFQVVYKTKIKKMIEDIYYGDFQVVKKTLMEYIHDGDFQLVYVCMLCIVMYVYI